MTLDGASVLVKPDVAAAQFAKDAKREAQATFTPRESAPSGERPIHDGEKLATLGIVAAQKKLTRFHGSASLDPPRIGRDAGRIAEEVIAHFSGLMGAQVSIALEINVEVPNGIPEDKVRIVSENCNTLKFKGHGFEEG